MSDATKFCHACGQQIDVRAEVCPHCGVRQAGIYQTGAPSTNRVAAGVLAILLGSFGVHKFVLGFTGPGLILLLVTMLSCGVGAAVTSVIGLVEGIIYLTKSDAEFYQTYTVERREWF